MPSVRFTVLAALSSAQLALCNNLHYRFTSNEDAILKSCSSTVLSCHNTTAQSNLCCFNSPGGLLLQTQFWDTDPSTGPDNSWTIHGLWPDECSGSYVEDCDASRDYTNITAILQAAGDTALLDYMNTYWISDDESNEDFWEHEWSTHGTCISTLDPDCFSDYTTGAEIPVFFNTTVSLFKTLPTYEWLADAGITPSSSETYTLSAIQAALSKNHGGKTVYIGCDDNTIDEVFYYFNVLGSVASGTFEPADSSESSSCSSTGISYPPKSGSGVSASSSATPTTSTASQTSTSTISKHSASTTSTRTPFSNSTTTVQSSTAPAPTSTSGSFSGKGYLNVITSGSQEGCIISYGTWYTTGTCATFTASGSGSSFTLTSSKGDCAISGGEMVCGASVEPSTFTSDGLYLSYDGQTEFYADSTPSGSEQGTVYTAGSGHGVSLSVEWQSV